MKMLFILLFITLAAHAQQERVAILNTEDNRDSIGVSDLTFLTDRLRETAVNILPKSRYGVMTTESIVAFLGSHERYVKECRESSCIAEIGRKVSADYVAQARVGRFSDQLSINFDLYKVASGNLIGSFTGESMNLSGLRDIIDEKAPVLFRQMPGASVDNGKSGKASFWVALGLDLAGAVLIGFAVYENSEMNKAYKEYNRSWGSDDYYENAWNKAEAHRSNRNVFYVIGGLVLASGIGVHIWF